MGRWKQKTFVPFSRMGANLEYLFPLVGPLSDTIYL